MRGGNVMKNNYLRLFSTLLILGLMIALGAGNAAFGQKGGKGNRGGDHGNHGNGGGNGNGRGNAGGNGGGNNGRGNGGEKHGGFQRQQQIQVFQNPNAGRQQQRQDKQEWKQA